MGRALSVFQVNLLALKHNFSKLKNITSSTPIFMVKANAYGHGLSKIVQYCESSGLCDQFGLASISELAELKDSSKSSFWIFSELDLKNNQDLYKKDNIIAVISNTDDLKYYLSNFSVDKLCLKLDTGMNRIGLKETDLEEVFTLLKQFKVGSVKHLMTHFSSSYFEINSESKTQAQFELFQSMKDQFLNRRIQILESSCSNSGAIEQSFGVELTHVRPGLMMYGVESFGVLSRKKSERFRVISSLKTEMINLTFYEAGTQIGYGNQVLKSGGWIGVIPLGYGDGLLTSYTNAKVLCGDDCGVIWGRTNMDMTFIYFSKKPQSNEVIIWSQNLSEFSRQVKSIPYQVLTCISQRVPKVYRF